MIEQSLLDTGRQLLLTIAPELRQRPLYVVNIRDFDGLPGRRDCLGWALDRSITEWNYAEKLGNRWQGPGPVIALDGRAIAEEARPGQFERCVQNVLIHEAAHVLPPPQPMQDLSESPSLKAFQRAMLEHKANMPEPEPGSPRDPHDWKFARRCCHLFVRACAADYDIPVYRLLGSNLWQSGAEHYLPYVLPEAIRMRDQPFSVIDSELPPAGLMELWRADLCRYHQFSEVTIC
jgi:hypothetical protein